MRANTDSSNRLAKPKLILWLAPAVLVLLSACAAQAGGVVTTCTEAALRAAMTGGGTVTFACNGTITLSSTITNAVSTTLDASSHQITVSGGGGVRVFYVSSNVTFTVINLKIANGASEGFEAIPPSNGTRGGGIYNDGGTLNLRGAVLAGNRAAGCSRGVGGQGGALFNQGGVVNATFCTFSNNTATILPYEWVGDAWQALGGAICNAGTLNLQDCCFSSNSAVGLDGSEFHWGPAGLNGLGGAVHNSGAITASRCCFLKNQAKGSAGATPYFNPPSPGTLGGSGAGGAIYYLGVLTLQASNLASNTAAGGMGGAGYSGTLTSINGAAGAAGGSGKGGAIFNEGTMRLLNCTIAFNAGPGGAGGKGGDGFYTSYIGGNGGAGGNGGDGCGGVYGGSMNLTNCTMAFNSSVPGPGGMGGLGGYGPHGLGQPGTGGSSGIAFGALGTSGPALLNSLLATNTPANASGVISDLGHNLSSDLTCAFFGRGSMNNVDPKLGPLANNGGPTLTMALLSGSPVIDAGGFSLGSDQRGFPRPAGLAADVGAFESGSIMPTLAVSRSGATSLNLLGSGNSNQSCRLLSSMDLSSWALIATNQFGGDGTALFHDTCASGSACRYYRIVMP